MPTSKNIEFARNLVKGKIAETVFAQMLRETKRYTVLEFGYEKVIPEMIQQGYNEKNETIETLRTAPDFAVIDQKTKNVRLIEVKYNRVLYPQTILKIAKRMHKSWNPSYLFIASQSGFYFDEISEIIKNNGEINRLSTEQVPQNVQNNYLKILLDFEK
jgi:hypothetical protein